MQTVMEEQSSFRKTYKVKTDDFEVTVKLDRHGDIENGPWIVRAFKKQPFDVFISWCKRQSNDVTVWERKAGEFVETDA